MFSLPVRIYWEDTDAGGVVYHAQYLAFLERARSDWMRAQGHGQERLRVEHGLVFAVRAMTLDFLKDASNVVLVGPNGVGKTMCACNLGYQAVLAGRTVLFITAAQLLGELTSLDSDSALRRRLKHYAAPDLLMIDEVGYLSYSNRHADLLFELVSRRYQNKSTVVTTNRAFADWGEVFPNAACVVSLIDRLMHRAEVVRIDGDSYRAKEADERQAQRTAALAKLRAGDLVGLRGPYGVGWPVEDCLDRDVVELA